MSAHVPPLLVANAPAPGAPADDIPAPHAVWERRSLSSRRVLLVGPTGAGKTSFVDFACRRGVPLAAKFDAHRTNAMQFQSVEAKGLTIEFADCPGMQLSHINNPKRLCSFKNKFNVDLNEAGRIDVVMCVVSAPDRREQVPDAVITLFREVVRQNPGKCLLLVTHAEANCSPADYAEYFGIPQDMLIIPIDHKPLADDAQESVRAYFTQRSTQALTAIWDFVNASTGSRVTLLEDEAPPPQRGIFSFLY